MSDIRAAVLAGPGAPPTIEMLDLPRLGRRAAIYAIGACGVSGADMALLRGDAPADLSWPITPGQEAAAVLQEIGSDLTEDSLGRRLTPGATVVVHGTGAIALLAVAAAQEMGAGRTIVASGPEDMFARLCRQFGAEATIGADTPAERVEIVRETIDGLGADLVLNVAAPAAAGLEMLRVGGTCIDLGPASGGPFDDLAARDLMLLGSAGHAPADLPGAIQMLHRARGRYPFLKMLSRHPLTAAGIAEAAASNAPKAVLVGNPDIIGP